MHKFILSVIIMSLCFESFGQSEGISGKIVDEQQQALAYVIVFLKKSSDSTIYKVETTNEAGSFQFTGVQEGSYLLKAEFLGYKPFQKEINFKMADGNRNEGTLQMVTETKELQAVNIVAEKPFIEHQADKTVVNIENSIIQTGSSLLEVMEKLPGVMVDQDARISLRGKQGVIIMMDGKPSTLAGQDLANWLRGMPSANIQKIELITNPSAKWDAAGNAGIINIISKRNRQEGYNGNISATYGQGVYAKYNASFHFSYKRDKINFFTQMSYANRKGFNHLVIDRKFYDGEEVISRFQNNNYIVFPFNTYSPRIGLDYFITPKTTISFLGAGVANLFNPSADNISTVTGQNGVAVGSFDFTNRSRDRYYNAEGNVQIQHKFDSLGQDLTVHLDYGKYWNNTYQLFTSIYTDGASGDRETSYLVNRPIGDLQLYSMKADYSKPLGKDLNFEAGVKTSLVDSDKNMQFFQRVDGTEIFDSLRSSHFLYSENINAAYINFNKKISKFSLQAGLRAEHTLANGTQVLNGQTFDRNYTQIFPTAYVEYEISEKHRINVNAGRRIDRPHYEQMNPFRRLIDANTFSEGNPFLQPQLTYVSEIGYSFANEIFVNFNYHHTLNNILDVLIQDAVTQNTNQTVVNLGQLDYYSLNVTYSKKLMKWWRTNTTFLSFLPKYKGTVNDFNINQGAPSFHFNTQNTFNIVEGLTMECSFQYNHRNLHAVTIIRPNSNFSIGFQKTILKKQGTITFNFTDIFWNAFPSGLTEWATVREDWTATRDTRVINLGFSYKFGKGQAGRMRRDTGADEEKGRM
jgi:hypothetical protein